MMEDDISELRKLRIYFDTNILYFTKTADFWEEGETDPNFSESVRMNMTKNVIALRYLLDLDKEWNLIFGTSEHTKKEIMKNRMNMDCYLLGLYDTLRRLSWKRFERDKARNRLPKERRERLQKRLKEIVKDDEDIEHLIEFADSGWDIFLTLDRKHILRKRKELRSIGLSVCSPLDFLGDYIYADYKKGEEALDLIRTALHGSWATHYIIEKPE
jgi:hypothetical protein